MEWGSMRHTTKDDSQNSVTRAEFDAFTVHVDGRFAALVNAIDRLTDKLDAASRPSYGNIIGLGGLLLTLVSFGGALIASQMSSVGQLSEQRDSAIIQMLQSNEAGSTRWTKDDHRDYSEDVERQFDHISAEMQDRQAAVSDVRERVARLEAVIESRASGEKSARDSQN